MAFDLRRGLAMAIQGNEYARGGDSRAANTKAVFVSHSSNDHELAGRLCECLEARGIWCWIAPRDVAFGEPWALGCLQGVAESESLLLLASENAIRSEPVLSEVEQAYKRRKPIYTVLIPDVKVVGEMDFYISRLHWITSRLRTSEELEAIAASLAKVLGKGCRWEHVASPPTLLRTIQYRPVAFAKMVVAVVLGLGLVLGGTVFALNRMLDLDFRRLGYVEVAAERTGLGKAMSGHFRIWLMAEGVRFADVRLKMAIETHDGVQQQEISKWPVAEQVGSSEDAAIPLGLDVRRLTTCLIVPNTALSAPYRVTQRFVLAPENEEVRVAETAEKRVSKEDASLCGTTR